MHSTKKKQKSLTSLGDSYRLIFEMVPDVIYNLSLDGKLTVLSPAFEKLTQWKVQAWVGKHFTRLLHKDDITLATSMFKQNLLGDSTPSYILRVKTKSGKYLSGEFTSVPENVDGKVVGVVGVARDITSQLQSAEELRRSLDQLKIIFENVGDGITVHDSQGNLIFVNPAASIASGYKSSKDMMANPRSWLNRYELWDEQGNPFSLERLPGRRALTGIASEEIIHFKNKLTKDDRWSIIKAQPVFGEDGKVQIVINIFKDVTERQQLESRKNDFITMASHELKTPLTSMQVYLDIIKKYLIGKTGDNLAGYVHKLDEQTKRLTGLVSELLDISRIHTGKLDYKYELFDIGPVLADLVETLQTTTSKHQIVVRGKTQQKIYADRFRIYQVLINILTNAIKYSPKGGKIVIKLEKRKYNIVVSITDEGIGIAEIEKLRIFNRLYQVAQPGKNTFPGLGIGLYIASEIIKRHQGRMWVDSEIGRGSTFYFSLPLKKSAKFT